MKKFLTMAAIALFTMTSCSEDDAAPTNPGENPTDVVLLKKQLKQALTEPIQPFTTMMAPSF